jgi:hypothetical protein
MTGTEPLRTQDRRRSHIDRRQHRDRRTHARPDSAEELQVLRELLGEAHARIRELEQALARLTGRI